MNEFKVGVVGYLPPKGIGHPEAFLQNLRRFPTKHPVYLFSESWHELKDVIRLKCSPMVFGERKVMVNMIFLAGIKIAAQQGLTHVIWLEDDCRVGVPEWDDTIWQEFLRIDKDAIMGGSPVVFNPLAWTLKSALRYRRMVVDHAERLWPIPVAGAGMLGEKHKTTVFVNGALAVYRVDWLLKAFGQRVMANTPGLAAEISTWDLEIGKRLWDEFEEQAYDKIAVQNTHFSGYGDAIYSEADRRGWLEEGRIVAVHQIKSDWAGPDPSVPVVKSRVTAKVEIFIVSFAKDIAYLDYCLRSIRKFATGFSGTTVLVPEQEVDLFRPLAKRFNCTLKTFVSVTDNRGHLHHQVQECRADEWCPDADFILHTDSDCIFCAPVSPEDYFHNGKPVLLIKEYSKVSYPCPWKPVVDYVLGMDSRYETMQRHPAVHPRAIYAATRARVEKVHKRGFDEFVLAQKADFPQGFTEYNVLGNVGIGREWRSLYHLIDVGHNPHPPSSKKLIQFWSLSPIDKKQHTPHGLDVVPLEVCKEYGL